MNTTATPLDRLKITSFWGQEPFANAEEVFSFFGEEMADLAEYVMQYGLNMQLYDVQDRNGNTVAVNHTWDAVNAHYPQEEGYSAYRR
jgi:hypothetical protein